MAVSTTHSAGWLQTGMGIIVRSIGIASEPIDSFHRSWHVFLTVVHLKTMSSSITQQHCWKLKIGRSQGREEETLHGFILQRKPAISSTWKHQHYAETSL